MLLSRLKVNSRGSEHQQAAKCLHVNTHQTTGGLEIAAEVCRSRGAAHSTPPPPYGRYLDEGPRMTLKTAEALPRVHWYPLVPRSSRRHQSQQEPMQEPADKQAHATSGSTGEGGGWGGGVPPGCGSAYATSQRLWALRENTTGSTCGL